MGMLSTAHLLETGLALLLLGLLLPELVLYPYQNSLPAASGSKSLTGSQQETISSPVPPSLLVGPSSSFLFGPARFMFCTLAAARL